MVISTAAVVYSRGVVGRARPKLSQQTSINLSRGCPVEFHAQGPCPNIVFPSDPTVASYHPRPRCPRFEDVNTARFEDRPIVSVQNRRKEETGPPAHSFDLEKVLLAAQSREARRLEDIG
ncbi:hypothetical protein KM043_002098 [Ampulex compressa]|nr:hypothetical protein KM043_002098 [Ampulex compressa]